MKSKKIENSRNVCTCCGVVGGDIDMTNNEWHFYSLNVYNNNGSVNKIMNGLFLFIHTFFFSTLIFGSAYMQYQYEYIQNGTV